MSDEAEVGDELGIKALDESASFDDPSRGLMGCPFHFSVGYSACYRCTWVGQTDGQALLLKRNPVAGCRGYLVQEQACSEISFDGVEERDCIAECHTGGIGGTSIEGGKGFQAGGLGGIVGWSRESGGCWYRRGNR